MTATPPFLTPRARWKARLRTGFAAIASLSGVAFAWHSLIAGRGVRILVYHGVQPQPASPFDVALEAFEAQAAYLADNCEVIDIAQLDDWRRGTLRSKRPLVVLTFDDGFHNNLEYAAPVLKRYGLPATFFVVAGKLAGDDARFMNAAQLRELAQDPLFRIGSHTLSHRSVARLGDSECDDEIGGSKTRLEKELGEPVDLFCYPYGTFNDFNAASIAQLKRYGFGLACTSVNGTNLPGTDPYRLRRTKVEWSDDLTTFRRLLAGAMDGWFFVDFFLRFLQRPRAVQFGGGDQAATQVR